MPLIGRLNAVASMPGCRSGHARDRHQIWRGGQACRSGSSCAPAGILDPVTGALVASSTKPSRAALAWRFAARSIAVDLFACSVSTAQEAFDGGCRQGGTVLLADARAKRLGLLVEA
jgi:hypothetical protein